VAEGSQRAFYRPLTTLSYLLNYRILGNTDHAAGYHWINFFLHWANTVLVYFAVLVLMERLWPAFFAGALFGTHPLATESVTNIIGRSDLFATLFLLVGFLCYVKSTTTDSQRKLVDRAPDHHGVDFRGIGGIHPALLAPSGPGSPLFPRLDLYYHRLDCARGLDPDFCLPAGWLGEIPFAAAPAVVDSGRRVLQGNRDRCTGVLMLYDFTFRIRQKHPNWFVNLVSNFWEFALKGYVVLAAPVLAMFYTRSWVFGNLRPPELPWVDNPLAMPSVGFWTARLTAIKVIGKYFWLLIWPQVLSCDYSYNPDPDRQLALHRVRRLESHHCAGLGGDRAAHSHPQLSAQQAALLLRVFLLRDLTAHFEPVPKNSGSRSLEKLSWCIGSIMAERFLYMPLIGFAGCVVLAVYAICRRLIPQLDVSSWAQRIWLQVVARTALSLMVVACGTRSFLRNPDWDDDERLWTKAVEACPNSFKDPQVPCLRAL